LVVRNFLISRKGTPFHIKEDNSSLQPLSSLGIVTLYFCFTSALLLTSWLATAAAARRRVTDITDTVVVGIELLAVAVVRAIIAGVAYTIQVRIGLGWV
jgi:hypothetical protein